MDLQSLQIEVEPAPKDIRFLEDRLYDYNVEQTGFDDGKWLTIFVRDDTGVIVAGIHGWTWGRVLPDPGPLGPLGTAAAPVRHAPADRGGAGSTGPGL